MSTENLKVVATADISGLKTGMNDARKELASTAVAATNYSNNIKNVTSILQGQYDRLRNLASLPGLTFNQYERINNNLRKVKSELDNVNKSFKNVVPGSSQAANALTNLGRVAQDAPFGFIGIQNNLNPLLESFQRLKAETGSTGSALKSLAGSLIGPAGLGLAISVVTSTLTVLAQKGMLSFSSAASLAKKANDEFAKSLKEAEAGALSVGVKLQGFVDIAKNGQLPLKERNAALNEANKILGEHEGKLTLASVATAATTELVKKHTEALVAQAVSAKFADRIADLSIKRTELLNQIRKEELTLDQQRRKSQSEQINLNTGLTKSSGAVTSTLGNLSAAKKQLASVELQLSETQNSFNSTLLKSLPAYESKQKATKKEVKDVLTISEVISELNKELRFLNAKEINLKTDESKGKITALENAIESLVKKIGLSTSSPLVLSLFAQIKGIEQSLLQKEILKITKSEQSKIVVDVDIKPNFKLAEKSTAAQQIAAEIDRVQKEALARLEGFRGLVGGIAESIAVSFGEGLGNIINGGGIGSFFSAIFQAVGAGLKQLGVYFIGASKLIASIKASLVKVPQLALIGGIALIALGSAISAAAGKQKAFATGVRGFEGGTALVGERGPELVQLPKGSNVVPNAQTLAMRGGGNLVVDYKVINGKDLAIILKRTNEFNNRNY